VKGAEPKKGMAKPTKNIEKETAREKHDHFHLHFGSKFF